MFFQRPQLLFQLRQNIVDTQNILLLILQLFLGCILYPLKLYDTGGLIKQLSGFLRPAARCV